MLLIGCWSYKNKQSTKSCNQQKKNQKWNKNWCIEFSLLKTKYNLLFTVTLTSLGHPYSSRWLENRAQSIHCFARTIKIAKKKQIQSLSFRDCSIAYATVVTIKLKNKKFSAFAVRKLVMRNINKLALFCKKREIIMVVEIISSPRYCLCQVEVFF